MELTPFTYEDHPVRVIQIDGEPWFVAADVCGILSVGNPTQALTRLDNDERALISNEGRDINTVSEAGLYALILGSRKPEAKAFKRWVTHEVLPSIRKTGSYGAVRELTEDELIHKALTLTAAKVESLTARLALVEPKADAFDRWLSSNVDYPVGVVGNVLAGLGADIGRNRLFDYMASIGWIYRVPPRGQWAPKQPQIDAKRLSVRLGQQLNTRTGVEFATHTVRITPKGAVEIGRRLGLLPEAVAEALANTDEVAA